MSLKAESSMGFRLTLESLARGGALCIRVRDTGCSSWRSRPRSRPDTPSWRGEGRGPIAD